MIRVKRKVSAKNGKVDAEKINTKRNEAKYKNNENIVTTRTTRRNAKPLATNDNNPQQEDAPPVKKAPKLTVPVYGDNSSFFDSIYHAIKKEQEEKLKNKRKTQRERLKAVKNVEVSTPVNRFKRKCELHFDISPISLKNSSTELPSIERHFYEEPLNVEPKIMTVKLDKTKSIKIVDQNNENSHIVPEPIEKILEVSHKSLNVPQTDDSKKSFLEPNTSKVTQLSLEVPEIRISNDYSMDVPENNEVPLQQKELSRHKIVKFVDTPEEKKASELEESKITERISLKPGKWRRSLAAWRKSHNPSKLIDNTSRKFVALFPIRTDPGVLDVYKKKLHESLEKSALLEQSDEGRLQAELSILDSSIECASIHKSYVLQRKTSQRETRVFKKSSIFYGISSPLIDVDILSGLSARQVVLRRCGQQEPLQFDDIYSESKLPNCKKIGEGVYGEVFMYKQADDDPVVLKIIPIEGDIIVNGGPQKRFSEILSEIVIAEELSALSNGKENKTNGFVKIKSVKCVKGAYPQHLLDAWEIYNDSCLRGSENDNPDIFDEDQLYIVFEQYNAGLDLEAFIFKNAEEAFSVFLQVALTLAVAENKFDFEHRDLHWGNILIARTNEKYLKYHVDGKVYEIPSYGVKSTIIDFTLSRMVYDGAVIYDNLAKDEELFESSGDYQFDIYRLMRYRLENDFKRYDPYTNLLWLHYLIDKLIDGARYKYSKSDKHKTAVNKMMQLRDELLEENQSASDFVKSLKN